MKTLQLKNVNKAYGKLTVLENLSLEVEKGEFVAIVGPSGCGKSTALRMLAGLEQPTTGEVSADGTVIKGPNSNRVMIFQEHALYPWRTIEDNVGLGLELANVSKKERRGRIHKVLEKVGLENFKTYYPHQLSGGMKQRASIARALVLDPEVLLLDEPYGALDAITRLTMQNELIRLWEGSNQTMVLITHDIDEALYLADRVFVLSSRPGKLVKEVRNDMLRPRDRNSTQFVKFRQEIMESLDIKT
ncbi:ABC transporter ATP-binding protein [Pseudalkalibacillus salsuginis]|uniref:ABC transporter ATP-binding protein n=1 Tax=Pseudalkalibacillus salsuginis TaxID=2910972 RepID=UPI001F33EBE5|nr:ABC transporter ATP-binding protein [Pseudalkalibacillus salsuginis]MCF6408976.1 ABC transporter ATP-binding protein [Pseudalkalibacillus salsuginis]